MTVPLTAGTCTATQPAVTAVPPQCVAGLVTSGTVTPVAVAGVTYDPAGVTTVALGQPVTVTATLAATAVAWEDPLSGGWVRRVGDGGDIYDASGDVG